MIGRKFCPQCDSEDVAPVIEGDVEVWMCNECGNSASDFPERSSGGVHYGDSDDDELEEYELHEDEHVGGARKSKLVHAKAAKKPKVAKSKSKSAKSTKKGGKKK